MNNSTNTGIPRSEAHFSRPLSVRFHDADPAGIMFFANSYRIAHDTYEEFVRFLGFEWKDWFENPVWAVPIRHSECEHLIPIRPARNYFVRVIVDRVGKSSFSLKYLIEDESERLHCEVSLVHTFIDKAKLSKLSMPLEIRRRLEAYQSQGLSAE